MKKVINVRVLTRLVVGSGVVAASVIAGHTTLKGHVSTVGCALGTLLRATDGHGVLADKPATAEQGEPIALGFVLKQGEPGVNGIQVKLIVHDRGSSGVAEQYVFAAGSAQGSVIRKGIWTSPQSDDRDERALIPCHRSFANMSREEQIAHLAQLTQKEFAVFSILAGWSSDRSRLLMRRIRIDLANGAESLCLQQITRSREQGSGVVERWRVRGEISIPPQVITKRSQADQCPRPPTSDEDRN